MKRTILLLAAAITLAGCNPANQELRRTETMKVSGLEDCKMIVMYPGNGGQSITVVRCPLSSVAVDQPNGKSRQTVVTIDGVEYVKKNEK